MEKKGIVKKAVENSKKGGIIANTLRDWGTQGRNNNVVEKEKKLAKAKKGLEEADKAGGGMWADNEHYGVASAEKKLEKAKAMKDKWDRQPNVSEKDVLKEVPGAIKKITKKIGSIPGKAIDGVLTKMDKADEEKRAKIRRENVPDHMLKDYDAGTLPPMPDLSIGGAIKSIKDKIFKKKSK